MPNKHMVTKETPTRLVNKIQDYSSDDEGDINDHYDYLKKHDSSDDNSDY